MGAVATRQGPDADWTAAIANEDALAAAAEIANAAAAGLIPPIAAALAHGWCDGVGLRSPAHWVAWRCGLALGRAAGLVAIARRITDLPTVLAAFAAGELSEDQTRAICERAPAHIDTTIAELAQQLTVTQLRRLLSQYQPVAAGDDETAPPTEERRVSYGTERDGRWRLRATLPQDEGAVVEAALDVARDRLFHGDDDLRKDTTDRDRCGRCPRARRPLLPGEPGGRPRLGHRPVQGDHPCFPWRRGVASGRRAAGVGAPLCDLRRGGAGGGGRRRAAGGVGLEPAHRAAVAAPPGRAS